MNTRFAFRSTPEQVQGFQAWLGTQIDNTILDNTVDPSEGYWRRYTEEGYRKGAGRAFDDTRKPFAGEGVSDFYKGTREEFLRSSFGRAESVEKVRLLASRTFTDLKGVTQQMATQMSRTLTDGLVQGKNPRVIARDLAKNVDGIGKVRSRMIARTEIIRAHAEGQLDAMERLGVEEVGVMVEWSSAGDDRVCPLCEALDGVVLKIKEARGIIPRHPNCRCAHIPANVGESKKGQVRGKTKVERSIDRSVSREGAKSRSLAEKKRRTTWPGADKTIAKKRPKPLVTPEPSIKVISKPKVPSRKVQPVPVRGIPKVGSKVKPKGKPTSDVSRKEGKFVGYHAGPTEVVESIRKDGLIRSDIDWMDRPPSIYFCGTKEHAIEYGREHFGDAHVVVKFKVDKKLVKVDEFDRNQVNFNKPITEAMKDSWRVEMNIPAKDIEEITKTLSTKKGIVHNIQIGKVWMVGFTVAGYSEG